MMRRAPEPAPDGSPGWNELVKGFAAELLLRVSPKQARAAVAAVRRFVFAGRVAEPRHVTAPAIADWLADLAAAGRSAKTLRNCRSALSTFCTYLVERGELAANPCPAVRLRRPDRLPARYLDADELERCLAAADAAGIGNEVRLTVATGLRLSELTRLQWADVDAGRRMLLVRRTKSHRARTVPLSQEALAVLEAQRTISGGLAFVFPARRTCRGHGAGSGCRLVDRPRSASSWRRLFAPVQQAVPKFRQLPGCSTGRAWHLLRHTFASRLAQAGRSLYKIAAWMGHGDVKTTQIYAHLQEGYDGDIEIFGESPPPPALRPQGLGGHRPGPTPKPRGGENPDNSERRRP